MKKLAVMIKSLGRDGYVQRLVGSVDRYIRMPYRLYVADEEPLTAGKRMFYDGLVAAGHYVEIWPATEALSVCKARNRLVAALEDEQFVLRLDDDFLFTDETRVDRLVELLVLRPELGAVSGLEVQRSDGKGVRAGETSPKQGFLLLNSEDGTIYKQYVAAGYWRWRRAGEIRFAYADFVRNFLLIRREVLDRVSWNETLLVQGEHLDFMMRIAKEGWLLAFTPDSVHIHDDPHDHDIGADYLDKRAGTPGYEQFIRAYREDWGISSVKSVAFDTGTSRVEPILTRAWRRIFGSNI